MAICDGQILPPITYTANGFLDNIPQLFNSERILICIVKTEIYGSKMDLDDAAELE